MKKNYQSGFGIRSETGEIYVLTKKERILTIAILRLTLNYPRLTDEGSLVKLDFHRRQVAKSPF